MDQDEGKDLIEAAVDGEQAPGHLPIMAARMASGDYSPVYEERELTEPVTLCDGQGRLNPEAKGWSRRPLHAVNLSGHAWRKKRWSYWAMICPRFAFSVVLADIDFLGLCGSFFIDFEAGTMIDRTVMRPLGRGCQVPERVDQSIEFSSRSQRLSHAYFSEVIKGSFHCDSMQGAEVKADYKIQLPPGHESLSVVIPWSDERFQFTSKHNAMPVDGTITVGGKIYEMFPETCHAVLDFGGGIWPYRTYWNWGAATGMVGGKSLGINVGGKWTTGTGANENGICYDGKLFKISEDLAWTYDRNDLLMPWRVRTTESDTLDLLLTPTFPKRDHLNLGLIAQDGYISFGKWSGTARVAGQAIAFDDLMGWAEECCWKW